MQPSSSPQNISPLKYINTNYTSCIKIANIPILPPLITDETRTMLAEYKDKAVQLEQKLQRSRDLQQQQQLERLPNPDINTSSDSSGIFTKSVDSSNKENYQRVIFTGHSFSQSHSELCDDATIYDNVENFSSTNSSPDKNSTINDVNLSPDNKISDSRMQPPLSENNRSCNKKIVRNLSDSFDKISSQTITYYNEGNLIEKKYSSSSTVYDQEEDVDDEDSDGMFQNSDLTASDNSVLRMLPESNKGNSSSDDQTATSVLRNNQQNLNLSPCKDLVLKSDVLSAINLGNITFRNKKRDLHLSREVFPFDNIVIDQNNDVNSLNKTKNVDNLEWAENNVSEKRDDKCNETVLENDENKGKIIKTPPKLIRQNSYTLDSPSPELLAFVEKQQQKESSKKPGLLKRTYTWTITSDEDEKKKPSTNFKPFKNNKDSRKSRKAWNVEEAKQQWNKQKIECSEVIDINGNNKLKQKNKTAENSFAVTEGNYKIPVKTKIQARSADSVYSLISDPHNVDNSNDEQIKNKQQIIISSPVSLKSYPDMNLNCNLRNLESSLDNLKSNDEIKCHPSERSSTMTLTPEKDTSCDRNSILGVPYRSCSSASGDSALMNPSNNIVNDDSVSICSSVSLNKFLVALHNTDKMLPTDDQAAAVYNQLRLQHYQQIEELLRRQEEELKILITSRPSSTTSCAPSSPPVNSSRSYQQHNPLANMLGSPPSRLSSELASSEARSCIRHLTFSKTKYKKCPLDYTEQERKAAVIISAYAKGYLVRRLFKTERVQEIIKSITDSIQCASNFDYSNQHNWTQADFDLHQRLIVQIEAATFSFREVFHLPTDRKMAIIRADRMKKKTPRLQPDKPVLSAATQRVLMRKKMLPQTVAKSNPAEKPNVRQRQRRKSFTGFAQMSSSSRNQQPPQLQKSASVGATNRQPWR